MCLFTFLFGEVDFLQKRSSYRVSYQCELLNAPARYLIGQATLYKETAEWFLACVNS
jgi:hypothetical protein